MRKIVKLPVKDAVLNVTVTGNMESKAVIVFLHGGPGSGAEAVMRLPAFQQLANTYTAVHFDQRGSGESIYNLSKGLSRDQIVDDVQAVVAYTRNAFPGRYVFLWGGSFGGLLGLLYLDKYPAEVDKAILSSPMVWPSSPEVIKIQNHVLERIAEKIFPEELMKFFKSRCTSNENILKFMESYELSEWLDSFEKVPVGVEGLWHTHAMRSWVLHDCDMRPAVNHLQIPTLFLQGIEDPLCPSGILLETIKNARNPKISLKTFSPCGHSVFEDCREGFCKECRAFYGCI